MAKVLHVRKKPITIQAVKASELMESKNDLPSWVAEKHRTGSIVFADDGLYISTLEGTMFANSEDWVLCGIKGEIYPCKADIFDCTYDVIA